ncbi:DUF3466 family protein [Thalassotalea atypica]|uniref:DUF3466 family protein n=1 Tax=Thalassotalea atypica TaxID=2054316 RepID=UPI0025747499|nr:DUF3466 family protein [Thalassotalea atypica]
MNKMFKSLVALSVASACTITIANAATYEVFDKGDVDSLKYTYSHTANESGDAAISGTDVYNFPVQFQYLDDDDFDDIESLADRQHELVHELEDLEDFEALKAGNPTANDLSWAIRFLEANGSSLYQKVGDQVSMVNDGSQSTEFVVYDKPFEGTDTLTRSTKDSIAGITNEGWVYGTGSAPYFPEPFTESDGDEVTHWIRDFQERGYVSPDMGQTIFELVPPEASFAGGRSAFLDATNRTAVGYVSNKLNTDLVEDYILDTTGGCSDPDVLEDLPFNACVQNQANNLYHLMAYQWNFSDDGQLLDEKELGLLVTPHENDDRIFQSYAQSVNSHGVAVGFSHGWIDEKETTPSDNEARSFYAVVFKDGEVISFTPDHNEHFDSRAYDINDSGIAVGHVNTYINGNLRTKFYYVDTNAPASEMAFVSPNDFFEGSSSTARAINENGFIVGEGEVETHNDSASNPRRTHAFLYDIAEDKFTDLNSFLSCNSDYTIIEARDINELNEISATAIVKAPRRDSKGELMLGEDGEQLVEDVVRAVTLKPIPGEVEDCSKVEDKVERKGGALGWGLLGLLISFGFRRKA